MLITSYLAFPRSGKKALLIEKLKGKSNLEVLPSENKDLIVLVLESEDKEHEKEILNGLSSIDELEHFSMVSGFQE